MKRYRRFRWLALGLAAFLSVSFLSVTMSAPATSTPSFPPPSPGEMGGWGVAESANFPPNSPSTFLNGEMERDLEGWEMRILAQNATSANFQRLVEADRLYQNGQIQAAERIYREVKPPFPRESATPTPSATGAITDPEQLSPAGRVFWREAQSGWEQNLESRTLVPLQMLVEKHPEFIPGQIMLARAIRKFKPEEADNDQNILAMLEQVTSEYPDQPDLVTAYVEELQAEKKWLESSITARQFALLNPDHPRAAEFAKIAEDDFGKFKGAMKRKLVGQAILSGAINLGDFLLTGNASGGINTLQLTMLLLQGESAFGNQVAAAIKQEYEQKNALVEDKEIVDYVTNVGKKMANLMGRNDFEYEFHVVADKNLNAFALPGGKVFVNTGALLNTKSEAELAGLLGHEVAHAVLSHGYQRIARGTLLSNLGRVVPLGNVFAELLGRSYSRQQEQQSDILGTRVLNGAGYAADGVRNLMVTLDDLYGDKAPPRWLSTHPPSSDRVRYLEQLIQKSNYNRYAFEGVEKHAQIQTRVKQVVKDESDS